MKKSYVKPGLFMESFEMAEHIAKCAVNNKGYEDEFYKVKTDFYADQCVAELDFGGFIYSFFNNDKCKDKWGAGSQFDLCYHGSYGDDKTLFGS